jgi:maltooligosyltrehalose trehalohydrolase
MSEFHHAMPWGASWSDGQAHFHLWAPQACAVDVEMEGGQRLPMHQQPAGRWTLQVACQPGMSYRYGLTLLTGERLSVSDPASRAQRGDVDSDSLVTNPSAYEWQTNWTGRPWHEAVVYELHVGALGGFAGVTEQLASLAKLGVTAVELMPVADFPGPRNWGYDGVLPFAPDASYGTPAELKRLVDTAHGLGMMVLLDVVYNHFGPDGNYLGQYAQEFFHRDTSTAWGGAINFGQPEVRSFFTHNALYWLMEYRFDGLRIDAAHAICEQDWLVEMAGAVRQATEPGRHVHLVLEHDGNAAGLLGQGFDAQWNDDGHHVLHVLLTGEKDGYYRDYAQAPAERLARCLAEGFIYQGEASLHRGGEARGEPSAALSPSSFVLFLQNHDQTGNRAFGERLTLLAHPAALRVAQALLLLTPQIPLLFMGEESGNTTPFLYFTSHRSEELAEAVRQGRRREFAATAAFADEAAQDLIADPNDENTFRSSMPGRIGEHGEPDTVWVRELLALRHRHLFPHLQQCRSLGAQAVGPAAVQARWSLGSRVLTLVVNLAAEPVDRQHAAPGLALARPGALAETLFDSGGVRHAWAAGTLPGHAFLALLEIA